MKVRINRLLHRVKIFQHMFELLFEVLDARFLGEKEHNIIQYMYDNIIQYMYVCSTVAVPQFTHVPARGGSWHSLEWILPDVQELWIQPATPAAYCEWMS